MVALLICWTQGEAWPALAGAGMEGQLGAGGQREEMKERIGRMRKDRHLVHRLKVYACMHIYPRHGAQLVQSYA